VVFVRAPTHAAPISAPSAERAVATVAHGAQAVGLRCHSGRQQRPAQRRCRIPDAASAQPRRRKGSDAPRERRATQTLVRSVVKACARRRQCLVVARVAMHCSRVWRLAAEGVGTVAAGSCCMSQDAEGRRRGAGVVGAVPSACDDGLHVIGRVEAVRALSPADIRGGEPDSSAHHWVRVDRCASTTSAAGRFVSVVHVGVRATGCSRQPCPCLLVPWCRDPGRVLGATGRAADSLSVQQPAHRVAAIDSIPHQPNRAEPDGEPTYTAARVRLAHDGSN
jgi:hypothetical protein